MNKTELIQRLDTLETEASALRKIIHGKTGTIIERVKTFEDVCEELGITVEQALPFNEELLMTPDRIAISENSSLSTIFRFDNPDIHVRYSSMKADNIIVVDIAQIVNFDTNNARTEHREIENARVGGIS